MRLIKELKLNITSIYFLQARFFQMQARYYILLARFFQMQAKLVARDIQKMGSGECDTVYFTLSLLPFNM